MDLLFVVTISIVCINEWSNLNCIHVLVTILIFVSMKVVVIGIEISVLSLLHHSLKLFSMRKALYLLNADSCNL